MGKAVGNAQDNRGARRWHGLPGWLLLALFALLVSLSLSASLLAYASRLPVDLNDVRNLVGLDPELDAPMGVNQCSRCHGRANPSAALYVAVNGTPIAAGQTMTVTPGNSFEIDFHFRGMLGDPTRFQGVGAQLVMPATTPTWRVGPGTPAHPASWSPEGVDGTFWSPSWDRASNGDDVIRTRWVEARDQPGAYHLTLGEPPLDPAWASVVFADRGAQDPGDRDGVPDHFGSDAIVMIPVSTAPGSYRVTVSGVGHDSGNRRAMVSLTFVVQITPRVPVPTPTPIPKTARELFVLNCTSCHPANPGTTLAPILSKSTEELVRAVSQGVGKMPPQGRASGGALSDDEIAVVVEYLKRETYVGTRAGNRGGPDIPHSVQGRLLCLVCHNKDGLLPAPDWHAMYTSDAPCNICHKAPLGGAPLIPHKVSRDTACLSCHAPNNAAQVPPITPDHGGRNDRTCQSCHSDVPPPPPPGVVAGAPPAPTPAAAASAPAVPHPDAGYESCLSCHRKTLGAVPAGQQPLPSQHPDTVGRPCTSCHASSLAGATPPAVVAKPTPEKPPLKPGEIPGITHTLNGRSRCLVCHDPHTGVLPYPDSHVGRPELSCRGCHKPAEPPRPATPTPEPVRVYAPAVPHDLEHRESCTFCHKEGAGVVPMPAGSHAGRTDLSCLGCHPAKGGESEAMRALAAQVDAAPAETPMPAATETPAPGSSSAIAPIIPHDIAGRSACTFCHTEGREVLAMPASHAGRTDRSCLGCHHAAAESGTSGGTSQDNSGGTTQGDTAP